MWQRHVALVLMQVLAAAVFVHERAVRGTQIKSIAENFFEQPFHERALLNRRRLQLDEITKNLPLREKDKSNDPYHDPHARRKPR